MATVKNTFVNFVSAALVHENTAGDGKSFKNVSLPNPGSKSGMMSIALNNGQVLAAKKKDGTVVDGYVSLLLGKPEAERKVSILTDKGYETIKMTNAAIAAMVEADRKAYRAARATETEAAEA